MIKSILMSLVVICICQQIHCQNILEGIYSSLAPNQEAYTILNFLKMEHLNTTRVRVWEMIYMVKAII